MQAVAYTYRENVLTSQKSEKNARRGYRFGFNGHEKDNEVYGDNNSYTAEYWQYDPRLGRRWNVDPVVKPHRSPYDAFSNNPIIFIDPNGADDGIFRDSEGNEIGDDGIRDGKVYVEKTTNSSIKEGDRSIPGAGIDGTKLAEAKTFISQNSGNKTAFENNKDIYSLFIEVESNAEVRGKMYEQIMKDDGKGVGSKNPAHHTEFGGVVTVDNVLYPAQSNVGNLKKDSELNIFYPQVSNIKFKFHSHSSGTLSNSPPVIDPRNTTQGSSHILNATPQPGQGWTQIPSSVDIANAGSTTNYMFARRSNLVYVYNTNGVQAIMTTKAFINMHGY